MGNIAPEVTLPLQKVVVRQIRLQGSCAFAGEYPKAIELLASQAIRVKPLISAVAPLDDGPRWFERLHSREPNLMKVVLTPGGVLSAESVTHASNGSSPFDLTGRVAVVTGTSRGLGQYLARALAKAGADLILRRAIAITSRHSKLK